MKIRINSYIPVTNVEGPGSRFCIWVQGCSIHCKGCANSQMWDKSGGKEYDTSEIISLIKAYKDKIEGITFLGGEPTEQIDAVIDISKKVQKLGLSVLVFTGHTYKELEQKSKFNELIKYVDILIDGRFEKEKLDYSRAWVGSSNQNYYFLTDRYNKSVIYNYKNKIEVRIKPNSQIVMTGMGDFEQAIKAVLWQKQELKKQNNI